MNMAMNVYEYGRGGKCVRMFGYTYAGIRIKGTGSPTARMCGPSSPNKFYAGVSISVKRSGVRPPPLRPPERTRSVRRQKIRSTQVKRCQHPSGMNTFSCSI